MNNDPFVLSRCMVGLYLLAWVAWMWWHSCREDRHYPDAKKRGK